MKVLALETATEACSAALYIDGEVNERYAIAPREHHLLVLPMIESLLGDGGLVLAQMDALAFGRGPGSFTGVRMATGVVQGLAFGADLPVAPVSTLAALAQAALAESEHEHAFACIDARMGEVYWGIYRRDPDGFAQLIDREWVFAPEQVFYPNRVRGLGIGSGWKTYGSILSAGPGKDHVAGVLPDRFPRAAWIARLGARVVAQGGCVSAEDAQPIYLRDNVAKKPEYKPDQAEN